MKRTRDDLSASESAHAVQFEIMHGLTRERCEGYTAMVSAGHARMLSTNPQNVNGVDLAVLFNNMALPWMPGAELVTSALWLDNKTAGASSHSGGAAANASTAEPHGASNDEAAEAGSSPVPPDGEAATPIYSDDLSSVPGPAFIRTVQLVASDGEMLIFANGSGSSGTADGTAQSFGPALSMRVAKHVGEQIFPGDVVLVTQAPLTQAGGEATASSVRLCTLDATAFDNAEAWQDAVSTNVVAALKWVSALCGQAPGLPQLTFMEASRAGDLNHTGNQGGNVPVDGWTRLLQLPLLLQVSRSLRQSLNRSVVEKLERSILSLLATMLSVFKHSQTVMSLPEIHRGLLHSFIASPLFVDGLSDILIRSADVLGSTPWQGVSESLAVGVELALTFACEPLSERDAVSGSVCTRTQEAAKSALGGFETVLHRLSGVWTEYTRKLQEMRRHGQQHVPDSLYKEQRIADMLEALAAEHTFRPVTRWLQQREVLGQEANLAGASGGGGGADVSSSTLTPLDRIQQPPTLSHIEALVESVTKRMKQDDHAAKAAGGVGGSILRSGVVEEQLLVMHRTYTPYLTKDVVRFVEAAAVAGHSELYGPAARAVCRVLQTFERGQPNEVPRNEDEPRDEEAEAEVQRARDRVREEAAAEVASQRMRVLAVEQHGLRAGGFGAYSFAELRHMAEYGLPVRLPLRLPKETSEDDGVVIGEGDDSGDEEEREAAARAAAAASAAATAAAIAALKARVARRHGGSCFAFLVVRFLGRAAVFPLIVTGVESALASSGGHGTDAVACAYVMREVDVLAEFVQTSGAIEESGLPDAWLLCGDDPCDLGVPEESLYYYSGRGGPHQHHSNSNNPFRGGAGGRHGGGNAGYRGGGGGHAYGGGGGRGGGRGRGGRGGRGSGRGGQRGGGRGSAGTSRGAVNETLSQELKPRFLPLGTPALTYIDLLTRLNKTRVELKEELNTGVEKGSYGRATLAASLGADASSLGLWMRYFAKGTAPLQTNVHGLSTNATGIVTGTGTLGKELSSRLLREATDAAASLTPAQVEALDTLSSGTLAQASSGSSSAFHATQYLANLRIVEGSVGSGKTSMLYAAGALKGKVLATARKEHQASVGAKLKDATARMRKCQTSIVSATSLAEIVPDEKSTTTTPETMSAAVEGQLSAFSRLSRGVQYCSTPLLIRCGRLGASETRTGRMPDATRALLYRDRRDLASGAASTETSTGMPTLGSLTELLDASLARSCKAPLALQLARLLDDLRAHAARLSALATAESDGSDAAAHKYLDAGLLPLIMSTREIQETFARASAADAAQRVTWASYLSTQLWATATVRPVQDNDEEDEEDEMEEKPTCPPIVTFPSVVDSSDTAAHDLLWAPQLRLPGGRPEVVPVQMPANIHLARLSMDEAAAWHAVFLKNQREAVPLLLHQLHSLIRRVFRLFLDLVLGVAATAQVGHFDLIASSDWELLQSYGLPFLWRWAPSHVLVDDFAGLQDGLLLALTPANSLTVSLSTEVPIYVERRLHRGPLSILRALRKDLQRTAALATTSLNESLRCPKAEVTASLGQMCLASGNVPFAGLLQPTMDKEEDDDEDGRRESEDAAKEKPCFPGFSSFSSLELWTHAVPVRAATTADEEAAAFICRSIRKHTRDTAGGAGSAKRLQVCFPFPQEARQFTEHHLLPNHHEAAREERRAWRSRPPHPESLTTPSVLCTVSAVSFPFTGTHPGSVTRESFLPPDYDPEDSEGALVPQRNTTATGVAAEAAAVGEETDGYECDIAILCLSSLVPFQPNLHGSGGDKNGGGGHGTANEGRAALWKGLLALTAPKDGDAAFTAAAAGGAAPTAGAPVTAASARGQSAFMERLQWWLWCTVSRAREGVIVVCSKEFALHVPMFQYVEKYVVQLRRQLCPARVLRYWLPRSTVCAVVAFNCPDHFRCRHTAAVVQSDEHRSGYGSRSACEVVVRGAELCESLCLQAYAHCTTRSHACLHPCHVEVSTAEAAGGRDDTHDHCPYPCGRTLSCGHPCNKDCGSVCDPCTFVGLTELPCGQRVVCGTNSADKSIQYELVRHFQESKCGAPLLQCTLLVTTRCPRCGTKSKVPCFQLTAHESRERQALKDAQRHEKRQQARAANGGNNSSSSARAVEEEEEAQDGTGAEAAALANIPFLLSDGECPGCVAVYNRVAAKFGFDAVPEPTVVQRLSDEPPPSTPTGEGAEEGDENLCAMRERATLPRHQLSAEAQAELRKAFAVAAKRAELLLMKEALEVSNGSAADTSDYVTAKRDYDTLKATQQRQIQERQDDIRGQVVAWAHRLRNEFTKQSELTANLEAMMPSLLSEAQDEAARQRRYGF